MRWRDVVFVPGNHEYYGASPREVAKVRRKLEKHLPNLHWLDRDAAAIGATRFVGATLWFQEHDDNPEKNLLRGAASSPG